MKLKPKTALDLISLYDAGCISQETAINFGVDPEDMEARRYYRGQQDTTRIPALRSLLISLSGFLPYGVTWKGLEVD